MENNSIEYINNFAWRGSRLSLDRMEELLRRMGNPQKKLKLIHVAGTNGKGSTSAMLASVLKEAGYKTGLHTSPYIETFHERIQIDGVPIPQAELDRVTWAVREHAESMTDHPTTFELVSAVAFAYFAESGCDIVVLETGLGGRLDATNIIDVPEVAVITAIGMDHMRELGDTLEKIAEEKAGIIKPGGTVVLCPQEEKAASVVRRACAARGASLVCPDLDVVRPGKRGSEGQRFDYGCRRDLKLRLLGEFQRINAAMAITVLDVLREKGWSIPEKAIYDGLARVRWPGRFELLQKAPDFIVDGAHNVPGVQALIESLKRYYPEKSVTFLTGVMADKQYEAMMELALSFGKRFITITPDNERAQSAAELAAWLKSRGAEADAADSVESGVRLAISITQENGVVCAFGSLYAVGQIRACFPELGG